MKKICLFYYLLPIFFSSCSPDFHRKTVNKVLEAYAGRVSVTEGISMSTESNNSRERYCEITLLRDSIFEFFPNPEIPASKIALIFNQNLESDERQKFDVVRVNIQDDDRVAKYQYLISELQTVEDLKPIFYEAADNLKLKKYDSLYKKFGIGMNPITFKDSFQRDCKVIDSTYGDIKELLLRGFNLSNNRVGGEYGEFLTFFGILIREKENTDFCVTVKPDLDSPKIYRLQFANSIDPVTE